MVGVAESTVVEIEIDGPRNENCIFRPLKQKLRGRFDLNRIAEPRARMLAVTIPEPIPGQRLRVDLLTKKVSIVEPLQTDEFAAIRERYERDESGAKVCTFAPAEQFVELDVATALYWMQAEVKAGTARLTRGQFPEKLPGEPRKRFYSAETVNTNANLATAIDAMANTQVKMLEVLERLTAKLGK